MQRGQTPGLQQNGTASYRETLDFPSNTTWHLSAMHCTGQKTHFLLWWRSDQSWWQTYWHTDLVRLVFVWKVTSENTQLLEKTVLTFSFWLVISMSSFSSSVLGTFQLPSDNRIWLLTNRKRIWGGRKWMSSLEQVRAFIYCMNCSDLSWRIIQLTTW